MANEEHINILEQGIDIWNKWRKDNHVLKPNLKNASLRGASLSGAHLMDADLNRADLNGADLNGTDLKSADLNGADLRDASLIDADLRGASLRSVYLKNASLNGANLNDASLIGVYFNGADLRGASLRNVNLRNAQLNGADLRGADLINATLINVDLSAAILSATIVGNTVFGNIDLSETIGLDRLIHEYPSTVGIDTIYSSKGKIPDVFLRKAGVPEELITYLPSLMRKAVDYYACFISFTEKDDQFSERLYNDLLAKGVRCWRWKEDAKWGKTLMKSIDEAVRAYDKLVVICSEESLQSPAVIREIERALQKEDELARQGKDDEVLFPVRLDDYIFTNWHHHRKADVLTKNVGDFRNWTDPDAYSKCLNRLLRDLKSESSAS